MFSAHSVHARLQICLLCFLANTAHAAPRVDWLKIQQKTLDKFKAGAPIAWTATHQLNDSAAVRVDSILNGNQRRNTVTSVEGEVETPMAQIIARDDLWYVTTDDKHTKDRPFETIFKSPSVYYYLQISELQLMNPGELDKAEAIQDGVATFRQPLSAVVQAQMRERMAKLKSVRPNSTAEQQEVIDGTIEKLEENISKGAIVSVDAATGFILTQFIPGRQTTISNLRWLDAPDPAQFDVAGQQWEDRTMSIAGQNNQDLAMFLYSADVENPETPHETVLFNLVTAQMRRVPIPVVSSIPGCFTKDRKKVLVLAPSPQSSRALYEVDFASRDVRAINQGPLTTGVISDPTLSPQGQWLGLLHKADPARQEWQVCALNLKTADVRLLGRPLAAAHVSWLPETNGVIMARHEFAGYKKPPKSTIMQLDLKGKLKPIRRGNWPFVLTLSKRILYQGNEADSLWYTCALDGSDPQLIGDGLEGFSGPSVAADEQRMLMVKGDSAETAQPYIVDLNSGAATPLDLPPGSWLSPTWR